MLGPTSGKRKEWRRKAAKKRAVVPNYFEISPYQAYIVCGKCKSSFNRNLVPNVNEPTFVCPSNYCQAKNWLPITYKLDPQ